MQVIPIFYPNAPPLVKKEIGPYHTPGKVQGAQRKCFCKVQPDAVLFSLSCAGLFKLFFINKVREEHVQIINTRGAQSVINPVNKIRGIYIYTQQTHLCSLTLFQHPSATPSPHLQLFLSQTYGGYSGFGPKFRARSPSSSLVLSSSTLARTPPRVSATGHGATVGVCCAHPNPRISLTSAGSVQPFSVSAGPVQPSVS